MRFSKDTIIRVWLGLPFSKTEETEKQSPQLSVAPTKLPSLSEERAYLSGGTGARGLRISDQRPTVTSQRLPKPAHTVFSGFTESLP